MATFANLIEDRVLIRITVPLPRGKFHDRCFYAYPQCLEWMRNAVPAMVTGRLRSAQTPLEQLDERLRQWTGGDPMRHGPMFSDLDPKTDNVWEMKTHDLRLFGRMYQPRKFVAVFGDYADDYKEPTKTKTYADARRTVVTARTSLPLDGIKVATGEFDELV